MSITKVELHNYKSIASCDLSLNSLNIFIGANGAGKSNLLSLFDLMSTFDRIDMMQSHIAKKGGPDAFLRYGRKKSEYFSAALTVADIPYRFTLEATENDAFFFAEEKFMDTEINAWHHQSGHKASMLSEHPECVPEAFLNEIKQWRIFHFNDTGSTSPINKKQLITDNQYLRKDGSNIASFLYRLQSQYPVHYRHIVKTVQRIAPFFLDFSLQPVGDFVELLWFEKYSDIPLKMHLLSDGIIRFICLATILLQPKELMPQTIIIDEPELGLHPFALNILTGLIQSVSVNNQLIISTQSPQGLNAFAPENIIVTDRIDGKSSFNRLNCSELQTWLDKYSLSDLWQMNYLNGGLV